MTTRVETVQDLKGLQGKQLGPTEWIDVTQEMLDGFATVSGDHQWIHVDAERAAKESPFGRTIAHGDLTLALVNGHRNDLMELSGATMGLNYGWDRVRYPAPVPVGSRVRIKAEVASVEEREGGWWHLVTGFEVEREGEEKPVFVGQSATRALFGSP